EFSPRDGIPDADGSVPTSGSQPPAVWAEDNTRDFAGMPVQREHGLSGGGVPDLDGSATGWRGDPPTVRAEGNTVGRTHHVAVVGQGQDFLPRHRVPDLEGGGQTGARGQVPPIGAKLHTGQPLVSVPAERQEFATVRLPDFDFA